MANKKFNYPDEETLKAMDKKLARVKGTTLLPEDASTTEKLKWALCAEFVIYSLKHKLNQREMAKVVGLSEARMSEILHYRFKRYTIDHLLKYLLKIKPDLKIKVA